LWPQGDEAIVSTFRPEREHPRTTNVLFSGYFGIDFFRTK